MKRDEYLKTQGLFYEDRSGFAFREVFTPNREGPLPKRPHPSGKGGPGVTSKPKPPHSPQALAYLARTVGGNEGGNAVNIAALIDGLVADGVWAKLDALYIFAQQNVADARLNIIGSTYNATVAQAGTFTAFRGLTNFDYDTGLDPTVAQSLKYTRNSANYGAWLTATAVDASSEMGILPATTALYSNFVSDGKLYIRVNSAVGNSTVISPAIDGLYVGDRADASGIYPFVNGVAQAFQTDGSTLIGPNFHVGNVLGSNGPTQQTIREAHIGGSLGAAGNLALYNRLNTYLKAVGALSSIWSATDANAGGMALSNGGLTVTPLAAPPWKAMRASVSKTSGKLYAEFLAGSTSPSGGYFAIGVANASSDISAGTLPCQLVTDFAVLQVSNGFTSNLTLSNTFAMPNDVWALAVDFTAGSIWIGQNSVWLGGGNPATGALPLFSFVPATVGALIPSLSFYQNRVNTWTLQFTTALQKYAPPSGFVAWG